MTQPDSNNTLPKKETEFYEHHRIAVDKRQTRLRIDKFLTLRLEGVSRNKIEQAAKAGCILVNDKAVKVSYKIKPLDIISVLLPTPPISLELLPENIPLNIVYEDDDILVINKPANLVVHPGYANFTGTLLNGLLYYLQNKTNAIGEPVSPFLAHRIDKDTTGLLLVAKNEPAQMTLAKQFYDHSVKRKYHALAWGDFQEDEGTIEGYLGRSLKDRRVMTVFDEEHAELGKYAVTHWRVLERFGYVTLLECVLETGRTHQIRAHLRSIGHPLFGDTVYGGDLILKGTTFTKYKQFVMNSFKLLNRQALHAKTLGFVHPVSGEHLSFDSEIPKDMASVIERWRRYTQTHDLPTEDYQLTEEDMKVYNTKA